MKSKLSIRLFLFFVLINVISIAILVFTNRHFATWNFDAYYRFREVRKLSLLGDILALEYQREKSWTFLVTPPSSWKSFIESKLANAGLPAEKLIKTKPPASAYFPDTEDVLWASTDLFANWINHLVLYDSQKTYIAGALLPIDEVETIPIIVNNETVGWLGIQFQPVGSNAQAVNLIKKQSSLFNIIAASVLSFFTIIVFVFSATFILIPIRNLSAAMKSLTDRNFDIRIAAKRNDELGILARRFNAMAQQLQEYDKNQQQWLSDISHELRTPLSVLIGEIEAFQNDVFQLDKASFAALGDEAKHLRRIVEDLHFISLAESNAISMEKDFIKPLFILTQTIYFFESRLKKRNISIEVQFQSNAIDLEILGDEVRLKQVFSNLIENALQHMNKPGLLTIKQEVSDGQLIVFFEDSGPGVPDEALPHLFDRLFKADPSRSRKTGSGIGLAICKTIVSKHNGKITAKNTMEGGLSIEISLPLANRKSNQHEEPSEKNA